MYRETTPACDRYGTRTWDLRISSPAAKLDHADVLTNILSYSPALTWRDVQHVIVRSARPAPGGVPLERGGWVTNKAGLTVSRFFGFGLMDAGKMVYFAKHWTKVPEQRKCKIEGKDKNRFYFYSSL